MDQSIWKNFKEKHKLGSFVSGKIIHKAPFGVFINVDGYSNVLLEIIQMKELDYHSLYLTDIQFKVGDHIEAYVLGFTEDTQQVRVTQKKANIPRH